MRRGRPTSSWRSGSSELRGGEGGEEGRPEARRPRPREREASRLGPGRLGVGEVGRSARPEARSQTPEARRKRGSEPRTQNPERRTQNTKPKTRNAERGTRNAEHRTHNPERRTQNPKPGTRNACRVSRLPARSSHAPWHDRRHGLAHAGETGNAARSQGPCQRQVQHREMRGPKSVRHDTRASELILASGLRSLVSGLPKLQRSSGLPDSETPEPPS